MRYTYSRSKWDFRRYLKTTNKSKNRIVFKIIDYYSDVCFVLICLELFAWFNFWKSYTNLCKGGLLLNIQGNWKDTSLHQTRSAKLHVAELDDLKCEIQNSYIPPPFLPHVLYLYHLESPKDRMYHK